MAVNLVFLLAKFSIDGRPECKGDAPHLVNACIQALRFLDVADEEIETGLYNIASACSGMFSMDEVLAGLFGTTDDETRWVPPNA